MAKTDFEAALGPLDDNSEMIRGHWRDVRANWQASETSLRRTVFYIAALAVTFTLVLTGGLNEIAFVGLKFKDLNFVLLAIPVIIGYLTFTAFSLASISWRLAGVHDDLVRHYWPNMAREGLEYTVRPVGSFADTAALAGDDAIPYRLVNFIGVSTIARFTVLLGGPVVFEIYAIYQLLDEEPGGAIIRYIAAILGILFIIACFPHIYYLIKGSIEDFRETP